MIGLVSLRKASWARVFQSQSTTTTDSVVEAPSDDEADAKKRGTLRIGFFDIQAAPRDRHSRNKKYKETRTRRMVEYPPRTSNPQVNQH